MTGAAIAGAIVTVGSFGLSAYGTWKEQEYRDEQDALFKKQNRLNYQEGIQQLDQARDSLETNLNQSRDTMGLEYEQTLDAAESQFNDSVANEKSALEHAGNSLSDWKKEASAEESAARAAAGSSGVRNSGTVQDNLELQEDENDEKENRAVTNINEETEKFSRTSEMHWDAVEDYEERYDQKLAQLEETYDQKLAQLDETETMLTKKYNAGVAIQQSQYDYASDGAWLGYVTGGMDAINTGLNMYSSLSNIFG